MFAFLFWTVVQLGVPAWWFARIAATAPTLPSPVGSSGALCAVPKVFTQPHLLAASVRWAVRRPTPRYDDRV